MKPVQAKFESLSNLESIEGVREFVRFFQEITGLAAAEAVFETQASSGHDRAWPSDSRTTSINLEFRKQVWTNTCKETGDVQGRTYFRRFANGSSKKNLTEVELERLRCLDVLFREVLLRAFDSASSKKLGRTKQNC